LPAASRTADLSCLSVPVGPVADPGLAVRGGSNAECRRVVESPVPVVLHGLGAGGSAGRGVVYPADRVQLLPNPAVPGADARSATLALAVAVGHRCHGRIPHVDA